MAQPTFGLPSSAPHLQFPSISNVNSFGQMPNGSHLDISNDSGRESYPSVVIDLLVNTSERDTKSEIKATTRYRNMQIGDLCFLKMHTSPTYQNNVSTKRNFAGQLYNIPNVSAHEKFPIVAHTVADPNFDKDEKPHLIDTEVWKNLVFVGSILASPPQEHLSTTSTSLTSFYISKYSYVKNYWWNAGFLVAGTTLWLMAITMPAKTYKSNLNDNETVTILVPWASSGYQDPRTYYDTQLKESDIKYNFDAPVGQQKSVNVAALTDIKYARKCWRIGTLLHGTNGNNKDELVQIDMSHDHTVACMY
jgi:hypothetical protein